MPLLSRLAVQAARAYGMLVSGSATNVPASYLVVAGGGGGGTSALLTTGSSGGGGGAGGFRTSTATLSTLNTYSITVGAGGAGAITGSGADANSGNNSVISGTGLTTITSAGGGRGGSGAATATTATSGGSGGGGAGTSGSTGANGNTPSTSPSQGNNGGNGANFGAGGGGGASAVGSNASSNNGGNGGAGTASSISGSSVTYAGGGGGGAFSATAGTGGAGGGGNGGTSATVGSINTGGGGGGGSYTGSAHTSGASGGSGIVIISYASATPKFVGGTLTTSGGNQIHTFTSSGTLSPLTPVTASYLVVAGGGGGGQGGGGAGGLLTSSTTLYSGASYIVTVGAGGTAGTNQAAGSNGSNSIVSGTGLTTVTSTGGGRGGYFSAVAGASGGSGGGGGGSDAGGGIGAGGAGTSGQGNAGGSGVSINTTNGGGGGGGAGAAGGNAVATSNGGAGGVGVSSSISGTSTFYAGGGSGGCSIATAGGSGGGGAGGAASSAGSSGTANTGGGGGGGGNTTGGVAGGAGGSGIVIISYAGSQQFNGGLVTSSGGNTIHTFTATGALTPLTNNLTNSLRFRASASASLSRTPTVASNRTTWTWSGWVKRGTLGTVQSIFGSGSYTGSPTFTGLYFNGSADTLYLEYYDGSAGGARIQTTQVFRDPSAWYHIVAVWDTSNATVANRLRLYVNGNQVTAFTTNVTASLNLASGVNNTIAHYFGQVGGSNPFDGYMTDINFIDGQALEPYFFGNNDANGVWKPIQYRGTYGTNGFYLNFSNTTSTTTLGNDSSPNGNNWTTNNISLTAGVTYDAMLDVPTNTSAIVANYAVLNPLDNNSMTLSAANLDAAGSTTYGAVRSTIAVSSGKYYFEINVLQNVSGNFVGIAPITSVFNTTTIYPNALAIDNSTIVGIKTVGVTMDFDNLECKFYVNNVLSSTQTIVAANAPYAPFVADGSSGNNASYSINFGQRPFSYTPPTGFVALNTFNLPTPTILQGNKYMDATTFTGTGVSNVIVNAGQFKPDFVWGKSRSLANSHILSNSVAGADKFLISNSTAAEGTNAQAYASFNSNGFTLGTDTSLNSSGATNVAWQWQAGQGTTSSNTSGSITSTVSVNATAGFSVVTYTGNATNNATIGHGLGVAPKMVITKNRAASTFWYVYHGSLAATYNLYLNATDAQQPDNVIRSTNSTTFTVSSSSAANGTSMVAYCWAEIAGFSKFGSYTGNGSADGPFIYTGFRPKFIMVKRSSSTSDWWTWDTTRTPYNMTNTILYNNLSSAEISNAAWNMDIVSNGFKLRTTDATVNGSGSTLIFMAFAENPFKNANAR